MENALYLAEKGLPESEKSRDMRTDPHHANAEKRQKGVAAEKRQKRLDRMDSLGKPRIELAAPMRKESNTAGREFSKFNSK